MVDLYRKKEQVIFREEGDGAFLFNPEDGNLKYLNRSAKAIYLLLDAAADPLQITNSLQERYPDLKRSRLERDVIDFLSQLRNNNLISTFDSESAHVEE